MINFNFPKHPEPSQTVITGTFSLAAELKKICVETIRDFAREHPNEFIQIAVDEVGSVELAEYLHHTWDLFELVDGLAQEALADAKDSDDYYSQIETNYRR